ncbi:hypothetical protein [Streptacidiphilus sp. EB129]|uniref:hypothetical protein n=1 Tax=Streptacidiphilus sp. EB129 TaxID=3156262 RepID=UPI00351651BF
MTSTAENGGSSAGSRGDGGARAAGSPGAGNSGVVISGGTVSDSVVVAGENNRTVVNQAQPGAPGLDRARSAAQELLRLLAGTGDYGLESQPAAQATAIAEELAEELAEQEPDGKRVHKWLGKLSGLVAGAAPLIELVLAIEEGLKLTLGG